MAKKHPKRVKSNGKWYKYSCSRKTESGAKKVSQNLRKKGYAAFYMGRTYIGYKEPRKFTFDIYKRKKKR